MSIDAQPRARQGRSGSAVSTKEIARASLAMREVTFTVAGAEPVSGFVFGYDDYHWKVAVRARAQHDGEDSFDVVLVHKSAAFVRISSREAGLTNEEVLVLEGLSTSFWKHCDNLLGKTNSRENSEPAA